MNDAIDRKLMHAGNILVVVIAITLAGIIFAVAKAATIAGDAVSQPVHIEMTPTQTAAFRGSLQ
ncbi:MAG: hypothetical protein JWN16_1000 [Alphaproteobacteria bacterium]|nr:hypothetical protein [Alphaproteobacteria bacterium]